MIGAAVAFIVGHAVSFVVPFILWLRWRPA